MTAMTETVNVLAWVVTFAVVFIPLAVVGYLAFCWRRG